MPKLSIVIPVYDMVDYEFFLSRALSSIIQQTFRDYEILITRSGKMAENTNDGIKRASGELKILFMDDYLAHKNALQDIVDAMGVYQDSGTSQWLITGADTNPEPEWTDDIVAGNNRLGSPSALTMRTDSALLFDERMSWLLDCDLYKRLGDAYGPPLILNQVGVNIGVGNHQMTNILTDEEKLEEHKLINEKYGEKNKSLTADV